MTQGQARTRDFSKKRTPVFFTIDGQRYDCFKALDFAQLRLFAALARGVSHLNAERSESEPGEVDEVEAATAAIDRILELMKIVMKKASYAIFASKLRPTDEEREADDFEPVDPYQLMDIVKWLMETYTNRPSQPSSSLSPGSISDDGGSSSTAGASPEAVTPAS